MKINKVGILGLGYVGFPLACAIAKAGKYEVVGYDPARDKIEKIEKRISPVQDRQAESDIAEVKIKCSADDKILKGCDVFIICVPTPIDDEYEPDLGPVIGAAEICRKYLKRSNAVIIESTINPGVCEEVVLPVLEASGLGGGRDFELAHCPERINPGDAKWNVYNIPRNIGALTLKGCKQIADFYRSFINAEVNEMETLKEAEATKIIENTFRDINIAYVNELAMSFDALGINVVNVIKGASNKPFAFMAHYPGCGVGGHCIAVDPYYLIKRAKKAGFDHKFLRNARTINNGMPRYTVEKLVMGLNRLEMSVKGSKIGLYGLSYKKDVADMRESPSLKIKSMLENEYESKLSVFDPYFIESSTHKTLDAFLKKIDTLLVATAHSEILLADFSKYKNIKLIIDGRNCLDAKKIRALKISYSGIGR